MSTNKGGRQTKSKLGISYKNRKEYDKKYRQDFRYIFTVNLSQEKDKDIIDALESLFGGNRQKALKYFLRLGIEHFKQLRKQTD